MNVIRNLNKGKAAAIDRTISKHLQEAHVRLYILITIVMNRILVHGYLPKIFMLSVMTPVIKKKHASLLNSSNYRPMAIA